MVDPKAPGNPARQRLGAAPGGSVLRAWLVFVATFAALQGLLDWGGPRLWGRLAEWTAITTAGALSLLGASAHADGAMVYSSVYNLRIVGECTALHPVLIFLAAIVAHPGGWKAKSLGIGAGVPSILAVNVIRLTSLCYVGQAYPSAFDTVHKLVWQSLIVFFTVVVWIVWANNVALRDERRSP